MNKKYIVDIGDVVLINYRNFNDELVPGLFAVIYCESYDIPKSSNFTAIKISTCPGSYQILLDKSDLKFLDHDSYLNCTSQFKFTEEQVLKILGTLTPYYLSKILQQTDTYFSHMKRNMEILIGRKNLAKF